MMKPEDFLWHERHRHRAARMRRRHALEDALDVAVGVALGLLLVGAVVLFLSWYG